MNTPVLNEEDIVFVTSNRVKKAERKENIYYYDIRHSDEDSMLAASISPCVWVNHLFTIGLSKPLDLGEDGEVELTEEDDDILFSVV